MNHGWGSQYVFVYMVFIRYLVPTRFADHDIYFIYFIPRYLLPLSLGNKIAKDFN